MNFYTMLKQRQEKGKPIRVGLIGAGKFGTMYLSQVRKIAGVHLVGIAELNMPKAFESLKRTGWPDEQINAKTLEEAYKTGKTCVLEDREELITSPFTEVIIDCTGLAELGIDTDLKCIEHGKHIVNVNVECDILAGPALAQRATKAGVVYSLAYGDQPAEICEMVDWARTSGFEVVCAGKGTRFQPRYHQSTPETVWGYYGIPEEHAVKSGMNPKLFNSFLDGTKSAIEMASVANCTGLLPPVDGLKFPPCGADHLPMILKPKADGGILDHSGMVEVVASEERDGRPVFRDLRYGIFVTLEGETEYMQDCFKEYGMSVDGSGKYTCLYRPFHMIGLELNISVASVGTRMEPTGCPSAFNADVAAVAKFDIPAGAMLDGEGGYYVYGDAVPARTSIEKGLLPLNFSAKKRVLRNIKAGEFLTLSDVEYDPNCLTMQMRKEMRDLIK